MFKHLVWKLIIKIYPAIGRQSSITPILIKLVISFDLRLLHNNNDNNFIGAK